MTSATNFLVNRSLLSDCSIQTRPLIAARDLTAGQVLLEIDRFAFTANNITYAALGDALRYWAFFPASEGQGIIPVWGFANVLASRCEGIEPGERFYGYYPMATHLVVMPQRLATSGFVDGATHRQPLSPIYNHYIRSAKDPLYSLETEALQMLLRPLFTTSFLLDDFFHEQQCFGCETLVLTSASSKTAIGVAFLLHQMRSQRAQHYEIVGLTSPSNLAFVQGLGCYDRVLGYDQVAALESGKPSAIVDFAGNGELLGRLHKHLDQGLRYSCRVGASHWDQRDGLSTVLPGPAPQMFFAPSQAEKRLKDWGPQVFQQRLAEQWTLFTAFVGQWMKIEVNLGPEAVERVYQQVLSGRQDPEIGHVLSLFAQAVPGADSTPG